MNSLRKSDGNNFRLSLWSQAGGLVLVAFLASCTVVHHRQGEVDESEQIEVSLQDDQQKLAKIREDIPEEKRIENDKLKLILADMGEIKSHPAQVRDRFSREIRNRQSKFNKDIRQARDKFNKEETKLKEQKLKELKEERDGHQRSKNTREETKEFYADQQASRKEFFDNQKDKRKDFETDMRQKEKDFAAWLREMRRDFDEAWRDYSKRYKDWEKSKKEKSRNSSSTKSKSDMRTQSAQELQAFDKLKQVPGTPLGAGDSE